MTVDMRWLQPLSSTRAHYMPYHDGQRMVRPICGGGPFNAGFARVTGAGFCGHCQRVLARVEKG